MELNRSRWEALSSDKCFMGSADTIPPLSLLQGGLDVTRLKIVVLPAGRDTASGIGASAPDLVSGTRMYTLKAGGYYLGTHVDHHGLAISALTPEPQQLFDLLSWLRRLSPTATCFVPNPLSPSRSV